MVREEQFSWKHEECIASLVEVHFVAWANGAARLGGLGE
jgi:hypothetical protein